MREALSTQLEKAEIKADVHSFYIDSEQIPEKKQKLILYEKLNAPGTKKPDIILVNGDPALNALLTSDYAGIDSIPTVFIGIQNPNVPFIQKYSNITGFYDKPDYRSNVRLIEQLIGKCIIIRITDNSPEDSLILEEMNNQVSDICRINNIYSSDRVRISGQNGISLPKDNKVKPDDMYISTISSKSTRSLLKGLGENYYNKACLVTKRDYLSHSLGRFCSFPSFSVTQEMIGQNSGVVGGYVTTLEEQIRLAVTRMVALLNGIPSTAFPQITETNKSYLFDYKILNHWNISERLLPANSQFLNIPFYVEYRYYLIFASILAGILLVVVFVYQRRLYKQEVLYKEEAQERLKQEKEFMSFALDSGNIYTFSYQKGIFIFDKRFYEYLGIEEKPITAEQFREAIYPEEQADFLKNRYKLDHGFSSRQITRRRYNFNGKGYLWWEFRYAQNKHLVTSEYHKGDVVVNGLCLNIQQIKETEQNLINARKKAEESDRMKMIFLANMSHEIRTPLNAIVGFSQLLGSDMSLELEDKEEFVGLISKNSDLLLKLINDILDLSRIQSGRISFTYADCDLIQLIGDVYNTHRVLMPEGVELRKKVPNASILIHTDRFRLTQVFTNLINNATKFTAEGYIELACELASDKKSVFISVTDTGKGIPKDKLELVFERFQKLDEFAQGTGLGLAISLSIIKTFNGRIKVESEEGKGSKFIITLPL